MLNNKKYRWLVELLAILVVLFLVRMWTQADAISGVAPNFNSVMLNGKDFNLYQAKKPLLLHFWGTWCPVCKLEQGSIDNIAKDYPVYTVAMQSGNDEELKSFMIKEGLSFNVINDEVGILSQQYNIRGVPVSIVINNDNNIEFLEVGYTTELGLRLRLWWAGL